MPTPANPDPTPDEIRERCLAIQATWSEAERERRASGLALNRQVVNREWLPPEIRVAELVVE